MVVANKKNYFKREFIGTTIGVIWYMWYNWNPCKFNLNFIFTRYRYNLYDINYCIGKYYDMKHFGRRR